jgi:hypothetical protein
MPTLEFVGFDSMAKNSIATEAVNIAYIATSRKIKYLHNSR